MIRYLTLFFSLFSHTLLAQEGDYPSFRYGIAGGYVRPSLEVYGETAYRTYKATHSFYVGAVGQYDLNEGIAIQTQLQYIRKGAQSYTSRWDTTLRLSYIQIPISLLFALVHSEHNNIYIQAGLYGAMGIDFSKSRSDTWYNPKVPDTYKDPIVEDVSNQFKGLDYGMTLGVQIQYSHLFWSIHYESGTYINSGAEIKNAIRNYLLSFSLGILLPRRIFSSIREKPAPWLCPE